MPIVTELDGLIEELTELTNPLQEALDEAQPATDFPGQRAPFVLSCVKWLLENREPIVFEVNPSEANFTFSLRETVQEVDKGKILHSWPDPDKEDDLMKEVSVNITFQSGNILSRYIASKKERLESPDTPGINNKKIAKGILHYFRYLDLFKEDRIYKSSDNFVLINFNSMLYPSLTLLGFFDPDPLQVAQSAQDPLQFTWPATFTIHDSRPNLHSEAELVAAFATSGMLEDSFR